MFKREVLKSTFYLAWINQQLKTNSVELFKAVMVTSPGLKLLSEQSGVSCGHVAVNLWCWNLDPPGFGASTDSQAGLGYFSLLGTDSWD